LAKTMELYVPPSIAQGATRCNHAKVS